MGQFDREKIQKCWEQAAGKKVECTEEVGAKLILSAFTEQNPTHNYSSLRTFLAFHLPFCPNKTFTDILYSLMQQGKLLENDSVYSLAWVELK